MAPEPLANSPIPDLGELIGRDLFLLVPLAVAFQTTYLASQDDIAASEAVDAWVDATLGYEVLSVDVDGAVVTVRSAGPLEPPGLDALDAAVDTALGRDVTTDLPVFAAETYPGAVRP